MDTHNYNIRKENILYYQKFNKIIAKQSVLYRDPKYNFLTNFIIEKKSLVKYLKTLTLSNN